MVVYEDYCVDCPPGMGCLGNSCPNKNVPIYYCDRCTDEEAKYKIDEDCYCEKCMDDYLSEEFDALSISEKADMLEIEYKKIM